MFNGKSIQKNLDSHIKASDSQFTRVSSAMLEIKNNYVHKTEFMKMRSDAIAEMTRYFGGEVVRLEAMVNTLLEELAIPMDDFVCETCGQPLPEKKCC